MKFIERMKKTLKTWWQPREALPQVPPVPGRPGGAVGNTRRVYNAKGESIPNRSGEGLS